MTAQNNENLSQTPVCPHASACGGCPMRDRAAEYETVKRAMFLKALEPLAPLPDFDCVFVGQGTRRRVTFGVVFNRVSRHVGLNEARSSMIVAVNSCALLTPALNALIASVRDFLSDKSLPFGKREGTGDVSLTDTQSGADMVICLPFEPDLTWRRAAADFAQKNNIARISWKTSAFGDAEPIVCLAPPVVDMAGVPVEIPAGCFLQPSAQGQDALTQRVAALTAKSKNLADLFCGAGTFSLALLKKKRKILACDTAAASLRALFKASQGRVRVEERDLFKTPLLFDELNAFDTVVLDPPRAGAKAQCAALTQSDVPAVVYVSCNPETFVRDAQILKKSGFALTDLTFVDQFVYSTHMELVARFKR